jgi:hypothetical protein
VNLAVEKTYRKKFIKGRQCVQIWQEIVLNTSTLYKIMDKVKFMESDENIRINQAVVQLDTN